MPEYHNWNQLNLKQEFIAIGIIEIVNLLLK